MDRTDVVIYTQGWDIDRPAELAPDALVRHRLFINGTEIPGAGRLRVRSEHGDFIELRVRITPSTCRIVPLANLSDIGSVLPEPYVPTEDV